WNRRRGRLSVSRGRGAALADARPRTFRASLQPNRVFVAYLCRNLCRTNRSVCWHFDKVSDEVSDKVSPEARSWDRLYLACIFTSGRLFLISTAALARC